MVEKSRHAIDHSTKDGIIREKANMSEEKLLIENKEK
jgi:hypothetical protein